MGSAHPSHGLTTACHHTMYIMGCKRDHEKDEAFRPATSAAICFTRAWALGNGMIGRIFRPKDTDRARPYKSPRKSGMCTSSARGCSPKVGRVLMMATAGRSIGG